MSDLTGKHQRFVAEYLRDCNASAAAVRAGYSPKSAGSTGPRLLDNPAIRAELDRRQGEIAREASISTRTLIAEAEAARLLAASAGNASAMIAAVQLKARLAGLLDDPSDPTDDDAQAQATEIRTAARMWSDAAHALNLPRDATPEMVIGAASTTAVWPPALYEIAHAAAREPQGAMQ